MQNTWVDFRTIKNVVSMEMVLARYNITWLRKKGDELRGRCPIHKGEGTDTFHASLTKNAFQCFSCKARGNVLDLVAALEQCSVREAAVKLAEWFAVSPNTGGERSNTSASVKERNAKSRGAAEAIAANEPLKFQLQGIEHQHPYLVERGISAATAEAFGVGFFPGKGSMMSRIVIPIHNENGELIAYAGRSVDGTEPRYKLPPGFHKSAVLFNLHRITSAGAAEVVLTEGFFGCIKVHEAGFPAVALMGSSLSETQERLLTERFRVAVLLFDGDDAGRLATENCLVRLGRKMWVRAIELPEGTQPDMFSANELRQRLA